MAPQVAPQRRRQTRPSRIPGRVSRQRPEISLEDRYRLEEGRIFLSGVQALARIPLDQHRADRRRGLRTATMVSGYQGSPLGGFDKELARNRDLYAEHDVFHVPAVNEELGATAVWGSQLSSTLPDQRFDGAIGLWYGKAPGLDRAADAIRHGNAVGVGPTGGTLALAGDDPAAKSSTLPSASESLLAALHVPVLFPGDVQEVLDLGAHALALSRASGLWAGLKIVTAVADATGTARVAPGRVMPVMPTVEWNGRPYVHRPDARLLPPFSHALEETMLGPRHELVLAYARENGLSRISGPSDAWLGIVAAGKARPDLAQALADLGLDERALDHAGVRFLHPALIWPLEPEALRRFAQGLDEILVVEEKGPFIEAQIRDILYGGPAAPRVVGKQDEHGRPLLAARGELDADAIARVVAARLRTRLDIESAETRIALLDELGRRGARALPLAPGSSRTPFFCSGCPHNSSTPAPDGELVGAGIGCHTMVLLSPEGRGEITGVTQMGGEGAQWIGMAPFTERGHFTQNIGDGTFHHSGSLAVRAAVAAGVDMTFKLLANGAVAMTGGQAIEGGIAVPDLTRLLEIEGVRRTIVTTDEPQRYRRVKLAANAEVRPRSELMAAQQELAKVAGVTVLIHDQECAAELRRKRRRGTAPTPADKIVINERVCEGCGDCGEKSSCLSVQPVETEFGRKTRIHQSSCNSDRSCLDGDCPSFLTVVPARGAKPAEPPAPPSSPDPRPAATREVAVRLAGIGGTGVVTVSQILGMAALLDGLDVSGLDQTGLSQKGGPVVSDLRLGRGAVTGAPRPSAGGCDLFLALDLLAAGTETTLAACDPARTLAVASSAAVPTGGMVTNPQVSFPPIDSGLGAIGRVCRDLVDLDAQALSEKLFGDHLPANVIVLGAAFQCGALPVSAAAMQQAFELNGGGVAQNLSAFAWGRAAVSDPAAVARLLAGPEPAAPVLDAALHDLAALAAGDDDGELRATVETRLADLRGYQGLALARRYAELVATVRAVEAERAPGCTDVTEAVAAGYHRLLAYKDEYEVARLHLDAAEQARIAAEFGPRAKVKYHLHPPFLRALGMKRKLRLGGWFTPALRLLRAGRRLRGTALDPFGHAKVRRTERALIAEYEDHVRFGLDRLSAANHDDVAELCRTAELVRGYEGIKLASVERFRSRAAELRAGLAA